jgi:hypothetical protein
LRRRPTSLTLIGVISDDDVTLIIQALFDIRTELRRIRAVLEDDDGQQGDEEEDS